MTCKGWIGLLSFKLARMLLLSGLLMIESRHLMGAECLNSDRATPDGLIHKC